MFNFFGKLSLLFVFFSLGCWLMALAITLLRDRKNDDQIFDLEHERRTLIGQIEIIGRERIEQDARYRAVIREETQKVYDARKEVDVARQRVLAEVREKIKIESKPGASVADVLLAVLDMR